MDGVDTKDTQPRAEQTLSISIPDSIPADYAEDFLERHAMLAVDGGLDDYDAAVQAEEEVLARIMHTYTARCYILWGEYHRDKWRSPIDRRVYHNNKPQTICVALTGTDREDALSKLDTDAEEFIEWWG
ncbi:hypothetical protein [Anaerohalosphaera lusitana]|nr:hypothetical protein [Anaerohalosphaera lusitana]